MRIINKVNLNYIYFFANILFLIKSFSLMNEFTKTDSWLQLFKGFSLFICTSFLIMSFNLSLFILNIVILILPNDKLIKH